MKAGQLGSENRGGGGKAGGWTPGSYLACSPSQAPGCGLPPGLSPWGFQTQAFWGRPLLGDLEMGKTQERGAETAAP